MAPVRSEPVIRPELLHGSGQPADVAVGTVRRGIPILRRSHAPTQSDPAVARLVPARRAAGRDAHRTDATRTKRTGDSDGGVDRRGITSTLSGTCSRSAGSPVDVEHGRRWP